jgi:outer membrane receptor protein involved in Fe transport
LTISAGQPALAAGRGAISGRVVDPDAAAVEGALVRVTSSNGLERVAVTERDGSFEFEGLPVGDWLLEVRAQGFGTVTLDGLTTKGDGTKDLEVRLSIAAVAEEVTVTASGSAEPRDAITRSVSVVERSDAEARGHGTLAEALGGIAGLRVQRQGGPGTLTAIRFRGLRSQDTSILFDGARLRDAADLYGSFLPFFEDLTMSNLGRVEVVRGAGSTLYGSNAVGGVVHMVPVRAGGTPWFEAFVEGGGLGSVHGRFESAGGLGARGGYSFGLDQVNVLDGVDGNDEYRNTALLGRATWSPIDRMQLTASGFFDDSRLDLNGDPYFVGPDPAAPFVFSPTTAVKFMPAPDDPDDRRDGRAGSVSVALDHAVNERWSYTARYTFVDTRRQFTSGPAVDPSYFELVGPYGYDADGDGAADLSGYGVSDFAGAIHTVDVRNRIDAGPAGLLTAGFEAEQESFDQYFGGPFGSSGSAYNPYGFDFDYDGVNDATRDSQWTWALFAYDRISAFGSRLQVGLGGRWQGFDLGETEALLGTTNENRPDSGARQLVYTALAGIDRDDAFTGDLSLAWTFTNTQTRLWAHVGNGFRAPSLYERFSNVLDFGLTSGGLYRAGDPLLEPELSVSADGGLEQTLFDSRLRIGATYFYAHLQRLIDYASFFDPFTFESTDPLGLGRYGGYVNTRGGLARGVELSFDAAATRWLDLSGSYTYTDADRLLASDLITASGELLDQGTAARALGIPEHRFSLQALQQIGQLTLAIDLLAQSEHDAQLFEPVFFRSRLFTFDGYARLNIAANYPIPVSDRVTVTLFGRVENVLDTEIVENGIETPGTIGVAGAKVRF